MQTATQLSLLSLPAPRPIRAPGPTPRARPPGTLRLLAALQSNTLSIWARQHYEERISAGSLMSGPYALVNDPDAIRHIFIDNVANYRKSATQRRLLAPLGEGLLSTEGGEWRRQRRMLAPLFTPRTVASFLPAFGAAAQALVERWRRRVGGMVELNAEMSLASIDVLDRALFSQGLRGHLREFGENVAYYFDSIGRGHPLDILAAPAWMPRLGHWRRQPAKRFFETAVDEILAARRRRFAQDPGSAPRDLLALLTEARDPETGEGLSEKEVRGNIIVFIAAGFETSANALTWSLYLLASQPEVREALEREADRELGAGALSVEAVERLVATRAVVEEAMRLYPPVGILTREAIGSDKLAGVDIRAGTMAVVAPWVLHRHRLLWDEPDHFSPWRFLPERRGAIHRFAYLPFGAGPRTCIGASFALQDVTLLLATILRSFRLDLPPGHKVSPVQRLSLRPHGGLSLRLTARD